VNENCLKPRGFRLRHGVQRSLALSNDVNPGYPLPTVAPGRASSSKRSLRRGQEAQLLFGTGCLFHARTTSICFQLRAGSDSGINPAPPPFHHHPTSPCAWCSASLAVCTAGGPLRRFELQSAWTRSRGIGEQSPHRYECLSRASTQPPNCTLCEPP